MPFYRAEHVGDLPERIIKADNRAVANHHLANDWKLTTVPASEVVDMVMAGRHVEVASYDPPKGE